MIFTQYYLDCLSQASYLVADSAPDTAGIDGRRASQGSPSTGQTRSPRCAISSTRGDRAGRRQVVADLPRRQEGDA